MKFKQPNTNKHKETPKNTASLYLEMLLTKYIPIYLEKHPTTSDKRKNTQQAIKELTR